MGSVFRDWVIFEAQTLSAVCHVGQSIEVFHKYCFSGLDGFLKSYLVFVQFQFCLLKKKKNVLFLP